MQRTIYAFLLSLVVCAAAVAQQGDAGQRPRNIILIGWDGAQRNHVKECLKQGELPTVKTLASQGAMVQIDVYGVTDTKAGWTEILTGYGPKVTGVYSNGRYRDVPAGLSVFERLKEHFGSDKFVCAAVIGKKGHCGEINAPFKKKLEAGAAAGEKPAQAKAAANVGNKRAAAVGRIVEENGVKYRVFDGSPYYTMHKSCDVWEYGLELDEKVGTKAIEMIEKYKDKPFFFFVHFAEVDHKGHAHGENSKEYNDALISNDKWTGKIIAKLKELGLYDKTLVYVTADHGFDEGGRSHKMAPFVFLASNDKGVCRDGRRDDITPTILARFGLDLGKFAPALDGRPLTQKDDRPNPANPPGPPPGAKKQQPQAKAAKVARVARAAKAAKPVAALPAAP